MENLLKKFIYADKKAVEIKLNNLKNEGKDKVYVALDFDRTITPYFNEGGEEISTWALLSKKLPSDIMAEEINLYKKYRPLDLEHEVEEGIPARAGAMDLFRVCKIKEIPAVILSAGIKDVIELWCRKFGIYPEAVLSTKLCFDEDGYVCGWNKSSLVHNLNKYEIGKQYFDEIQKKRPHAILVGDSMDDAAMIGGNDNVLRLFIDDQHNKAARGDNFYDKVFKKFDLVIQSGSLSPVVKIIESI